MEKEKKDTVRISVYENPMRCAIRFNKNAYLKFNGPYVRPIGKGDKMYFYPATPTNGTLVTAKNGMQIGRKEYVDAIAPFEGLYNMLWDEALKVYYIRKHTPVGETKTTEPEAAPVVEEPKAEKPKAEKNVDVAGKLTALMAECIDSDDLAGAKALLKAVRAFGGRI